MKLILFDIDGTLLDIHGAGRVAFQRSLRDVFGVEDDIAYISFFGATDRVVLDKVMARWERTPGEHEVEKFFEQLPVHLEQTILEKEHTLHPGVGDILDHLHAREDIHLGLVTGNIRSCAFIKLKCFGLEFYFSEGGFGDDHADRSVLARLAVERILDRIGGKKAFSDITLVGDARSDMEAARAIGARAVGVLTGQLNREELTSAGADHVLENLSDVEGFLGLVGFTP
jgi:phosphoglycolate phosphatase